MSASYISLIESGRRNPTDHTLSVIADILGVSIDYLREGEHSSSELRTQIALNFARIDLESGAAAEARDRLSTVAGIDDLSSDLRTKVLLTLAEAHELLGSLESAIEILEPVREFAIGSGDFFTLAASAMALTRHYIDVGDLIRAVEIGVDAVDRLDAAGLAGSDEHLRVGSTLLWALVERGYVVSASYRARRLIVQAEELGTPRGRGSVYWNAALVAEERHDYTSAKQYSERVVQLLGEYDGLRSLARLRLNLSRIILNSPSPDPRAALDQLEITRGVISAQGSEVERIIADTQFARAHLMLGNLEEALDAAESACSRLPGSCRLESCEAVIVKGDALHALGDIESALEAYGFAAQELTAMSATRRAAAAWRKLGDRWRFLGRLDLSSDSYAAALDEAGYTSKPVIGYRWAGSELASASAAKGVPFICDPPRE